MKIAVVTSCVAGVAQSKMAASALATAAEALGYELVVEQQGGHKVPKRLGASDIATADVVIFAKAVAVSGRSRFVGKPILETKVGDALRDPKGTLARAVALAGPEHDDSERTKAGP